MNISDAARQMMHGSYSPYEKPKVSYLSMFITYLKGLYHKWFR